MTDVLQINLWHGDCREQLDQVRSGSVDLILTDPPYELGFMGRGWDSSGIAFDPTVYEQFFRVLRPGAWAKVFSATRTFHRVCKVMDDAGFEGVKDNLEAWCYGSGFPKSLNISRALDKKAKADRKKEREIQTYLQQARKSKKLSKKAVDEAIFGGSTRYSWVEGRGGDRAEEIYLPTPDEWARLKEYLELDDRYDAYIKAAIPEREHRFRADGGKAELIGTEEGDWGYQKSGERWGGERRITRPLSELAKKWKGYGTALKPAWEPIVCGRKPA